MEPRFDLFEVPVGFASGNVPCGLLRPSLDPDVSLPLCLLLPGGRSGHECLANLRPRFEAWWAESHLPPMAVAMPSPSPLSDYLDDPGGGPQWETFTAQGLPAWLKARFPLDGMPFLAGISMGGYGALKIAFAHPGQWRAVAAIEPMLEPGFRASDIHPRNRFYHDHGGPPLLLGPERDPDIFAANNPACRAVQHAAAIRAHDLAIYLEAGDSDALLAHDGAEFLHRVLWDLDIPHEYRLTRGADHMGPSLPSRIQAAFQWLGDRIKPPEPPAMTDLERAWRTWLENDRQGSPPSLPLDPSTETMGRMLRLQVAEARSRAERIDPSTARRFGILPTIHDLEPGPGPGT